VADTVPADHHNLYRVRMVDPTSRSYNRVSRC